MQQVPNMAPLMILPILIMLFMFAFMAVAVSFWIWMIVDCVNNEPPGNDKIVWLLIVILLNWVGGLVYFFARRGPRRKGKTPPPIFAPDTPAPPRL